MWAQLISVRLKPGTDTAPVNRQIRDVEQPGSGLIRTLTMRDQNDPDQLYTLAVFESEEKARAREQDPRRTTGLQLARATMAEVIDGPLQFTDLTVVEEWAADPPPARPPHPAEPRLRPT